MTEVAQGEQPSALDTPQEFTDASSYRVRDELAGLIERDLLGPWDGEAEVLPPRSSGPGERYLVGRIGPRRDPRSGTDAAGDTVDTEIAAGGDGADGELPDLLTMQNAGRMWASSMGLSCVVASGIDTLTVTAAWGRYGKADVLDEAGNPRRCWSREPVRYVRHVRFGDGASQRIALTMPDPRLPGVYLAVDIRPRANGADSGAHVVQLGLVNAQEEPAANKDAAWLFQPALTVTAAVEQELAVFCPIDDPLDDHAGLDGSPEDRHLRLLYRDELRHAVGRNVAVHAHVRPGERHAYRLETTWLPAYEVAATIAPPAEPGSHLHGVELSMDALAAASAGELAAGLGPLADGYAAWLDEQEERVADLPGPLRETARTAVFTARQCADRIRAGIELVSSPAAAGHETALQAFRFANEAMALQRRHTTIAAIREADGLSYAEAAEAVREQGRRGGLVAAFPARVRPAEPARPHRSRASRAGSRRASGTRRPAVLPDRRREDRGVPRAGGLHVRGPPAAADRRQRDGGPQRRGRRGRADALHAAAAHRPAVPARGRAGVRGRGPAPVGGRVRGYAMGRRAVPDRAVGRQRGVAQLVPRSRPAGRRRPRRAVIQAGRRAADAGLPVVRDQAAGPAGPASGR